MFRMKAKLVTTVAMAAIATAQPAQADRLGDAIGGIIGGAIINELNKDRRSTRPKPQRSAPRQTAPRQAAPKPQPVNPAARAEPTMTRTVKQQIQSILNIQGFRAGGEDGVFGKGTRAAIRRYQSASGYAATGYLTQAQLQELQNAYVAAVNSGQHDIPQLVTKADLRVLQTALKQLGYYRSTIDGVVGRGTSRAIKTYLEDRGLNPDQVDLADAVIMAAGEVGLRTSLGKPTAPVILADSAAAPSLELGTARIARPAPLPGGYLHLRARGSALDRESRETVFELGEELALQLVAQRPEILEKPEVVSNWFERKFRTQKRTQPGFDWASYNAANFLAKESILENFAGSLLEQADARVPISEENPLYLALYDVVNTGRFTDGKGLDLSSVRFGDFAVETGVYFPGSTHNRKSYRIHFDNHFATPHLPLTREEATRFLDDHRGRGLVAVYWIKVTGMPSGEKGGRADYVVERLTLHSQKFKIHEVPLQAVAAPVFEWALQDGELVQNLEADAQRRANDDATARSGLVGQLKLALGDAPVQEGRLASFSGLNPYDETKVLLPYSKPDFWSTYRYVNRLSLNPDALEDQDSLRALARVFLSEEERQAIAPGGGSRDFFNAGAGADYVHSFYDAFTLRDIYARIRAGVEPRFRTAGALVQQPVGLYTLLVADLGKYDFGREAFPIKFRSTTDPLAKDLRLNSYGDQPTVLHEGFTFPKELKVSPDMAQALRAAIPTGQPLAFVLRGTLVPPTERAQEHRYKITDISGTLYDSLDRAMILAEFGSDAGTAPVQSSNGLEALAAAFEDVSTYQGKLLMMGNKQGYQRINAALLLGARPEVLEDDVAALQIAQRMLTPEEQIVLWDGQQRVRLRDLNPFQIRRTAETVRTTYRELLMSRAISLPIDILHEFHASIRDYDFENQSFPLVPGRLSANPLSYKDNMMVGLKGGYGDITLPQMLPMAPDQAEQLYEQLMSPNFVRIWVGSTLRSLTEITDLNPERVDQQRFSAKVAIDPQTFTISHDSVEDDLLELPITDPAVAQPAAPAPSGDAATIAAIRPATQKAIAQAIAQTDGTQAMAERIARTHLPFVQANEFDQARMLPGMVQELLTPSGEPLWLAGEIELGRYNFEQAAFAVASRLAEVLRYGPDRSDPERYDLELVLELAGATPFAAVPVPADRAERLVSEGQRKLKFLVQVVPGTVSEARNGYYGTREAFAMLGRYKEAIFYVEDTSGEIEIVAQVSPQAEEAPSQTHDFSELSTARNRLSMHMLDLLMVRELDALRIDQLMPVFFQETWRSEQLGRSGAGPRYFDEGEALDPSAFEPQRAEFKSWFMAKSAALGDSFTLIDTNMGYSEENRGCQYLTDFTTGNQGSNYSTGRALGEGLDMAANKVALGALDWKSGKPVLVPEVIFGYGIGWPTPDNRNCMDGRWTGLVQVHDVPTPPIRSYWALEYHKRETDVTVTSVELHFDNETQRPWVKIQAEGEATRLMRLNSQRQMAVTHEATLTDIAPVDAAPAEGTSDDKPDQTAAIATPSAPAPAAVPEPQERAVDAAVTTEADAPDEAQADPQTAVVGLAEAPLELLGVKLGDGIDKASAMLRKRPDLSRIYETADDLSEGGGALFLRVFLFKDDQDALVLASMQQGGPVVAISRKLVLNSGVLPADLVQSSLAPKYGPPDVSYDANGIAGWATGPLEAESCLLLPENHLGGRSFQQLDAAGNVIAQVDLSALATSIPALRETPVLGLGEVSVDDDSLTCGDILQFTSRPDESDGKMRSFTMLLSNNAVVHGQMSPPEDAEPEAKIDF